MTAPVFVDTNVFVYAHQANERTKQPLAVRWLERLWREQLSRTSIQVLNVHRHPTASDILRF
jgi:predicted nucleic acid-binding protein